MAKAVAEIPNQLDNWLITRNVTRIRSWLFDKSRHVSICGELDDFSRCMSVYDTLLSEMTSASLIPQQWLARAKSSAKDYKVLKSYSATVHGVNLILNRLPGKAPRERAAISREFLGRRFTVYSIVPYLTL